MATVTTHPPGPAQGVAETDRLYRISLDQYHRMADLGILKPNDRVVLLDGVLVKKMTRGERHVAATKLAVKALEKCLPPGWHVAKEDPVLLPAGPTANVSEPEPVVSVLHGEIRDFTGRKPVPSDIALVVEVADSSLAQDRLGLARYAWAGIPSAWIVNLAEAAVEFYNQPTGPVDNALYLNVQVLKPGAEIPVLLDGREAGRVAVADVLVCTGRSGP
jgi:hypothetical protein